MEVRQDCVECTMPATHILTEGAPWQALPAPPAQAIWCRWHAADHAAYRRSGIDDIPRTYVDVDVAPTIRKARRCLR